MDYIGINSPAGLPQLKDITNLEIVMPTNGAEAVPEGENGILVVTGDGSLLSASE